jgi:hypothetical protein
MRFYNTVTNEYPRYQGDLELLGWIPGNPLPENWVNVIDGDMPEVPENKIILEDLPKEINGVWTQSWKIDDSNIEDSGPPPMIKFSINR